RIETEISGNEQVINLLEIDLSKGKVDVMPALSYGVIYGFENLSETAERAGAYAAVNGGFFSIYGEPAGLVIAGGELHSASSGKYPVFVTDGSKAGFKVFQNKINISVNGGEYAIDDINTAGTPGRAVLYTPVYGSSNRADSQNVTYIIEQGKVTGSVKSKDATKIPKSGMLLTLYLPFPDTVKAEAISEITINTGDSITFEYLPYLGENANAYECGHMILENGKNVAGAYDAWIGVLTNRDPRTVIGIKNESTVVLMTVDGRQPGYSVGLTALETAEFLKEYGVTDAAMLDGGASTEMIVNGNIVNKPSFEGQERKVAGAVIVKKR
ncbi:MAG: phosphodiester glycosidase family protein, partial [Eubacteriales bacterium]|nr:phosphodiester glycosidase family protein [Eubacteriales bacterium]